jgi:transcriptional regulator with XRE-family HTH domain
MVDWLRAEIKRLREEQGLTVSDLARKSGVDRSVISRFESGQRDIKIETLERIGQALGQTVSLEDEQ